MNGIDMKDIPLALEQVESKIVGAGVIPVMIDKSNNAFILLGRERFISHWRGSYKWSAFEGGRKFDESVIAGASREFFEESMGVVALTDANMHKGCTMNDILDTLQNGQYFARILLCIHHNEHRVDEKRYHIAYIVQVPWQEDCLDMFEARRESLLALHSKMLACESMRTKFPNEFPFVVEDMILKGKKVKNLVSVELEDTEMIINYDSEEGTSIIKRVVSTQDENVQMYHKWYSLRKEIDEMLRSKDYFAFMTRVVKNPKGFYQSGCVNDEFLEKQEIRWWRTEDLRSAIGNSGVFQNDIFRAYFMPILQRLLVELGKYGI